MKKIFSFLRPYRIPMGFAVILMLVELGVELLQPLLMAKIIDEGILKKDLSVVMLWGMVIVGVSLFAFAGGIINSFTASHVSQSFGYDIRKQLFEKVQSFSFTNLTKFPTSSLITRMTNDVTVLQNTVFMSLRIMMRAPLIVIGGAIMALTVNVKLALVLVISIPILVLFISQVMKHAGRLFRTVQGKLDSVNSVMRENLTGMRLIKAFLRNDYEEDRFDKANDTLREKTSSSLRLIETTMPVLLMVMNISVLVILWIGSKHIQTGDIKVGVVVAIVNYATRITASFSVFSWLIMSLSRAKASVERVNEVFDTEVDLLDTAESRAGNDVNTGKIEFQSVFFSYPGSEESVLKNISFTAEAGETVAILGATGSGKTSLFQLIPRLFDVNQGTILLDNLDIKSFKLDHLRKQIGYVPQEALLFSGSIRENIAWGKEGATSEEILEAAKNAQIHESIMKLPNQYDTLLGQKGVNLSGGQKQRLSIARALVRRPKILLLDDSTSALDLKTEAKLLTALNQYTSTTLIITQKVSTAMAADSILLMQDGEMIAKGTHETLLSQNGLYQQIAASQFGKEGMHIEKNSSSF
ncbi:ABC transporter ATP-binding protein [Actinomycetes bacterium NPDC127524]